MGIQCFVMKIFENSILGGCGDVPTHPPRLNFWIFSWPYSGCSWNFVVVLPRPSRSFSELYRDTLRQEGDDRDQGKMSFFQKIKIFEVINIWKFFLPTVNTTFENMNIALRTCHDRQLICGVSFNLRKNLHIGSSRVVIKSLFQNSILITTPQINCLSWQVGKVN